MSARALYIGVDVHEKESQVAVYEEGGELLQEKRLPTRGLPRAVSSLQGGKKHVGIESVGFIYPIYDALLKTGCDVTVANPNNIQLIARTKIKHDKVDARVLGELLRTNFFPRSHIPDAETREKRLLTRDTAVLLPMLRRSEVVRNRESSCKFSIYVPYLLTHFR